MYTFLPCLKNLKNFKLKKIFKIIKLFLKIFSRRVRTLYSCGAGHETELSFEPGQIITNGILSYIYIF